MKGILYLKERPMKSEVDGKHPSSHYLVVEDPQSPSTWHLRYRNMQGAVDAGLLGSAHAALLDPKGFRGNRYQGPGKQMAIRKLRTAYAKIGKKMPSERDKDA